MNASDPDRMRRGLKNLVRTFDQGLSRLARRRILIDIRTPVYAAVLGPVYRALASAGDVRLTITSEHPDRIAAAVDDLPVISHAQAEWPAYLLESAAVRRLNALEYHDDFVFCMKLDVYPHILPLWQNDRLIDAGSRPKQTAPSPVSLEKEQ